jgi:WD40 repeat protein
VRIWRVSDGKIRWTLLGHTASVINVAFSPDGENVASASLDATIRIWDVATGTIATVLTGHASRVDAIAYSPDGKLLASGGADDGVRLWNVATGVSTRVLTWPTNYIYAVAFSPDGHSLATGSADKCIANRCTKGSVRLWDVRSGKAYKTLGDLDGGIVGLAFSPDGNTLAAGVDSSVWLMTVTYAP